MKFLEAKQLAEQKKAAGAHENKMMIPSQNKGSSKRHSPPVAPTRTDSTPVQDDARALARSLGIDLSTIIGTGPNGQILPVDVRKAASAHEDKDKDLKK